VGDESRGSLSSGNQALTRLLNGSVEFRDADCLAPGDCDICDHDEARYCVGGRYFCVKCLTMYLEQKRFPPDVIAFRLPLSAAEMLGLTR
jgi:hypothetical protein